VILWENGSHVQVAPALLGKVSWYLLTTGDRMIPPLAQRSMAERTGATVTEADASHSVCVSQPHAVVRRAVPGARHLSSRCALASFAHG
jgi:Alpha/beta hydrolase family